MFGSVDPEYFYVILCFGLFLDISFGLFMCLLLIFMWGAFYKCGYFGPFRDFGFVFSWGSFFFTAFSFGLRVWGG